MPTPISQPAQARPPLTTPAKTKRSSPWPKLALSFSCLILLASDWSLKRWVESSLPYGRGIPLLPGRLYLIWLMNWRYLAGAKRWQMSPWVNASLMAVVALLICAASAWHIHRTGRRKLAATARAVLLLGITTHLLDLLHTGGVVDYLWIPVGKGWAFNLGDVAIIMGGILIAAEYIAWSVSRASLFRRAV